MPMSQQYIAKTFQNLEPVLAQELEVLGAKNIQQENRAVAFSGDQTLLYKANLHLHTALKILNPIASFNCYKPDILYQKAHHLEWEAYMNLKQTFAIEAVVNSPHFKHSGFAALRLKDAIVDRFRKKTGKRPSVDTQQPDIALHLHISNNQATIYLDSSGTPLFKRGYRVNAYRAPLNEVLAAGILRLSGWQTDQPLIDPMCGSGTLAIEAAIMAYHIAPGLLRQSFAFQQWADYSPTIWKKLTRDARQAIRPPKQGLIQGGDISARAISIARENAQEIGLQDHIRFQVKSFDQWNSLPENSLIVCNPPYDQRIKDTNINELYASIGTHMKHHFAGHQSWLFSGNKEAIKHIGLKHSKKISLLNGAIACWLLRYDLYAGSRKKN